MGGVVRVNMISHEFEMHPPIENEMDSLLYANILQFCVGVITRKSDPLTTVNIEQRGRHQP